ncbi:MAG: prepilin-type N-terminal cleavage/methylation domain-containing protein [bacterium]
MKLKNIFKKNTERSFIQKGKNAGFTLVETMVAITVLLTTIVGPMEIASKALFSSYYARDQITAYYLAQEGVEYIRNFRDTYYLQNPAATDWPGAFSNCTVSGTNIGCKFDVSQSPITMTKCDLDCGALNYDSSVGRYSYLSSGTSKPSKYTRVVTISQDANTDAVFVTSTISWTGSYISGSTKSFTIKESLYKWQTK